MKQHDGTLIGGTFRGGDQVVQFEAEMPSPLVGIANVTVGDARLVLSADAAQGEIRFDAGGAILTAARHVLAGNRRVPRKRTAPATTARSASRADRL